MAPPCDPFSQLQEINIAIEFSLRQWVDLIQEGKRRSLEPLQSGEVDCVIFTDGSAPMFFKKEVGACTVGGVVFFNDGSPPLAFKPPLSDIFRWRRSQRRPHVRATQLKRDPALFSLAKIGTKP